MNNLLAPAPSTELDAIYKKNRIQCEEEAQTHGNTKNPNLDTVLITENDAQMVTIPVVQYSKTLD